ncbi:MAG: hypothetical protein FWC96_08400 [Oscillospiraceae bacterium]|nr:hypothetical protein [Oscillospiraceae bacterium]
MKPGEIIDGYRVLHNIRLGGIEHIVAESDADHYRVFQGSANNAFGIVEY